jgi:membrane fusion protein (multidrug efflux system)
MVDNLNYCRVRLHAEVELEVEVEDPTREDEDQMTMLRSVSKAGTRVLAAAGLWLLLAPLGGCARPARAPAPDPDADVAPVAVKLVAAREVKTPRVLALSGSLIGAEEAQVAAGAAGKVIATYVERGSYVKKGAVLARLDARAVSAQAAQAAADVESLKAQAAQAQVDCERTDRLFAKGAIARADYDKTRTQCQTTKYSVQSAEARKTLTTEALHDTEIRAPFSGLVVERAVTAGEYVRVDSRVATLVNVDSLRVEITVPEADVPLVRQGMQIDFRTAGEAGGRVYHGKIRYVGPAVRQQSRDAIVEAVFDNDAHDLRPGMFVTARLAVGEQSLPAVPAGAVRADGNLRHVYVAIGGRLEDRLVQAGEAQGAEIPIVSGLKAGEEVVAELTPDVRDGARVK